MKIIIIGAGEVGLYVAQVLSEKHLDVVIIEQNEAIIEEAHEKLNVKIIEGNGGSAQVLLDAGVNEADFFLAMTAIDITNILSCSIAKTLGAKYTIARIHHETYSDSTLFNYQLHFGIDHFTNPEALCALELIKAIRNPGRIAVEKFARGQIEIQQVDASPKSKLIDIPLSKLQLPGGLRIASIYKELNLVIPRGETEIAAGEKVTLVGTPEVIAKYKKLFNPEVQGKEYNVTIFGATETAVVLARMLAISKYNVRIIEKNPKTCLSIAKKFPNITVVQGDGTSLRLMEEEQIGNSDYFIACTRDDEDNFMTCFQSKKLGAKHAMLVINKSDYESVLEDMQQTLGIENAVSPRNATARSLTQYIHQESYIELATVPGQTAKIIELTVSIKSRDVNKAIKDIIWPENTLIIGLQRKFEASVPDAEEVLLPNDRLLLIASNDQVQNLVKQLT